MKVFISVDMEGITGTTLWDECNLNHSSYGRHVEQMTKEVVAACEGAIAAGATEIVIKDAHNSATNIDLSQLPEIAKIIRGWSGHPNAMVDGIDASFDAAMFIGYHSAAGIPGNPLSHTMTGNQWKIKINGEPASEFMIYSYAAAHVGVPTVFLSGDKMLCEAAKLQHPTIKTVAVKDGFGGTTINYAPKLTLKQIREVSEQALKAIKDKSFDEQQKNQLPAHFEVEISYKEHTFATRKGFYPGAKMVDALTLKFETDDYFEVLRLFAFVL